MKNIGIMLATLLLAAPVWADGVQNNAIDTITQVNTKVLKDAPAIAMGNLFQATAQALSNAAHNATNAQQQSYVTMQAATTQGVTTLYSIDTTDTAVAGLPVLKTAAAAPDKQETLTPKEQTASGD